MWFKNKLCFHLIMCVGEKLDIRIEMDFLANLTAWQANCDKDFPDRSIAMATLHRPSQDIYI